MKYTEELCKAMEARIVENIGDCATDPKHVWRATIGAPVEAWRELIALARLCAAVEAATPTLRQVAKDCLGNEDRSFAVSLANTVLHCIPDQHKD